MRWSLAAAFLVVSVTAWGGASAATVSPMVEAASPVAALDDAPTLGVTTTATVDPSKTPVAPLVPDDLLRFSLKADVPALEAQVLILVRDAAPEAVAEADELLFKTYARTDAAGALHARRASDTTLLVKRPASLTLPSRPERDDAPAYGLETYTPAGTTRGPTAPAGALATQDAKVTGVTTIAPATRAAAGAAMGGILLLAGLGLYHRIRPNAALENETRKLIFDAVCAQPGLGVHAIAERANVSYSTTTYHLERLVAAQMLVMTPDGNKLCYYKNGGAFTEAERRILPILKNEEASRLLDAILETPGTYRAELASRLGVTATTINWHLKRLREAGLVHERREGRNAYLFVDANAMRHTMGSLVAKVPATESAILARIERYRQGEARAAST